MSPRLKAVPGWGSSIRTQEVAMKFPQFCRAILAASLLAAVPALAQSPTPNNSTVQKQHTDGADNPSNPREYQGAAQWHKQHTESTSPVNGSPSGVAKQN